MMDAPDQFQILISRLGEDPALGTLLGPEAAVLIWDHTGGNLLWASPAAAHFAAALVDDSGQLNRNARARPRLEALAGGLAPADGIRLERLLLDPARLSPPMTCACRLAALPDGTRVLVTVVVGSLPEIRQGDADSQAAAAECPSRQRRRPRWPGRPYPVCLAGGPADPFHPRLERTCGSRRTDGGRYPGPRMG